MHHRNNHLERRSPSSSPYLSIVSKTRVTDEKIPFSRSVCAGNSPNTWSQEDTFQRFRRLGWKYNANGLENGAAKCAWRNLPSSLRSSYLSIYRRRRLKLTLTLKLMKWEMRLVLGVPSATTGTVGWQGAPSSSCSIILRIDTSTSVESIFIDSHASDPIFQYAHNFHLPTINSNTIQSLVSS